MPHAAMLQAFGRPSECVVVEDYSPAEPGPGEVLLDMLAAPVNPADINIIEGQYGELPELPAVLGNEGAGRVVEVGTEVTSLQKGDLVCVLRRGTWASRIVVPAHETFRLPPDTDPLQASLLAVNPPTALLMLEKFVRLAPGDWVVQNAANSAVGRSVIQIARALGLRTLNVVRRPELIEELTRLGADRVVTEEQDLRKTASELCEGAQAKLALNAVGGPSALNISNALAPGSPLVTYGGMARQPLKIPVGLLIFRDLRFCGFWLTRWKAEADTSERQSVFTRLASWLAQGNLTLAIQSVHPLRSLHEALDAAAQPSRSGKVLLDLR